MKKILGFVKDHWKAVIVVIWMISVTHKLTQIESDVRSIKSDVSTIEWNVGTIESDVSTIELIVGTIESDVSTIKKNVSFLLYR
jgi:hypothetical protein